MTEKLLTGTLSLNTNKQTKCKGRGCLLFKRDLRRFYRQIGIDIVDSSLVGYTFNGYMYFDKVLSMGF